jgi:hypothetical protein
LTNSMIAATASSFASPIVAESSSDPLKVARYLLRKLKYSLVVLSIKKRDQIVSVQNSVGQ